MPTVVDSSGWIEYFAGRPNADAFEEAILNTDELIIPTISIFEVYRWVQREFSEPEALAVAASMRLAAVVPLDAELAVTAAGLSHQHKLPLADGIIYATARQHSATLLTQDSDLEGLPSVTYVRHPDKA